VLNNFKHCLCALLSNTCAARTGLLLNNGTPILRYYWRVVSQSPIIGD
jgi:hypothetical protein